jgi:hypothetical protein
MTRCPADFALAQRVLDLPALGDVIKENRNRSFRRFADAPGIHIIKAMKLFGGVLKAYGFAR